MSQRGSTRSSVTWHKPKPTGGFYRRPFAYSTMADSQLLSLCAYEGLTWNQVLNLPHLSSEVRYIVRSFIEWGYGDTQLRQHVSEDV